MDGLIKVSYEAQSPTVSARELHEGLEIKTAFKDWFPRMAEYGFAENQDFVLVAQKRATNNPKNPITTYNDYQISVDMAKQICMIQRSEKGRQYRQYFLDLEKAWNTPEQIFARALKMADKEIEKLKTSNAGLLEDVQRMRPKEIFADAVSTSRTSILIGDLAKLLKQNGIDIGPNRLFGWMRENGYLIKRNGSDWNMPTQKAVEMKLFEVKESATNNPDGSVRINRTTKVTGKGQQYFINKFLGNTDTTGRRVKEDGCR